MPTQAWQVGRSSLLLGILSRELIYIVMTQEQFDALFERLESFARQQPTNY